MPRKPLYNAARETARPVMPSDASRPRAAPRWRGLLNRFGFYDTPQDADRRQHVRYTCAFPVSLRFGRDPDARELRATAVDISLGGMLVEGAEVPDGIFRVQLAFEIPAELRKNQALPERVSTAAAIRYRDSKAGTLSLAFAEPLRPKPSRWYEGRHWILMLSLLSILLAIPIAYFHEPVAKYVAAWSAGYLVTLLLTPLLRRWAIRAGVVDVPDERRAHQRPTPRGGGLALVVGFYVAALVGFRFPWEWSGGSLDVEWLNSFILGSSVLVLVGLLDDVRGLKPPVKLFGQVVAASLMFASGNGMDLLLGYDLPLPLDYLLTLLWFVALTNAFNLIDGLDGLATGLALVAAVGLMGAFFIRRMPSDAMVMLGLAGACVAFLRYNFHPASIFLGDTGSMFLGFAFASIALATGSKGTFLASIGVPLLAVGIPVFDSILAIWRRSVRALAPGSSGPAGIMQPDTEHLHHRLRQRGLNNYQIAVVLYVINAVLVLVGLLSLAFRDHALGFFLVAFVAGAYVVTRHLAEVELWDTGRALIRGLSRPEKRVAAFFLYPVSDVLFLMLSMGIAVWVLNRVSPGPGAWEEWLTLLPIWVAPVFLIFCGARIYSRVWSLARSSDYLLLTAAVLGSAVFSLGVSALLAPDSWRRYLVLLFVFTGLAHVATVGSRMTLRGLVEVMAVWQESQHYKRGGIVRRVLLYGSGSRCLLYLRERAIHPVEGTLRRMIVGIADDDTNLRFRRVGGYVVLGTGADLPRVIRDHRVDEVVITAQLREESFSNLVALCALNGVRLSEWHYEERVIAAPDRAPDPMIEQTLTASSGGAAASASAQPPPA